MINPPFDSGRILAEAAAAHRAGRLADAEAAYRNILDAVPDHADALHLLGLVRHQLNDHETGAQLIERAIAINPSAAFYYSNLGRVRWAQQRYQDAIQS